MKFLRAIIKLIVFLAGTLFLYSLIMFSFLGKMFGLNYNRARGYFLRTWGKMCCRIIGIELKVNGKPPDPPFLMVSNHLSYIDVFVLFSQLRCLFVAKSDVKSWPFIGFIARTCGILFIDRNRKRDVTRVNDLISKNITEDQGIILFPEGTTSPGLEILPFRTSLLEFPAAFNFPVSYAALTYSTSNEMDNPAYKSICWWSDSPFFIHFFELLKMKSFYCTLNFGDKKIINSDRKELAMELNEAVQEVFTPVISADNFEEHHGTFKPLTF